MKITRITLWEVPLTSHETYYMAGGKTCDTTISVVLRLDTDDGLQGWGEVCPIPHYLPAYAHGVIPAVEEMAPVLLGADPIGPEALMERLNRHLQGHPYAKSAVDTALWDLTAQAAQLPLYALLGGRAVKDMPLYHSITCVAPDEMARMARDATASDMRSRCMTDSASCMAPNMWFEASSAVARLAAWSSLFDFGRAHHTTQARTHTHRRTQYCP